MASLTSTVEISGSINGRKITLTDTCILETVYDVAARLSSFRGGGAYVASTGYAGAIGWTQDGPSYLMMANKSSQFPMDFDVVTTAPDTMGLYASPGFVCILQRGDAGMMNLTNSAASTNLFDVETIATGNGGTYGPGYGIPEILIAFNAES